MLTKRLCLVSIFIFFFRQLTFYINRSLFYKWLRTIVKV